MAVRKRERTAWHHDAGAAARRACVMVPLLIALSCKLSSTSGDNATIASVGQSSTQSGGFLVDTTSLALGAARDLHAQKDPNAALVDAIAANAVAVWYGGWNTDVKSAVQAQASAALKANAVAVMVAYNITQRDCGGYSAGGLQPDQYKTWIAQMAAGIGSAKALVILEPDAVAGADCLSSDDQNTRYQLLSYAVSQFKAQANTKVYIDAGHPGWQTAATMGTRLQQAGIANADGFALNVSNYMSSADNISYGQQIRAIVKKNFIIDSSRNGNGDNGQWCNPDGRAIGQVSTTNTGTAGVDAFIWVQLPGSSDGSCNGGPSAGTYWSSRAVQLAQAANFPATMNSSPNNSGNNAGSNNGSNGGNGGNGNSGTSGNAVTNTGIMSNSSPAASTPALSSPSPVSSNLATATAPASAPQAINGASAANAPAKLTVQLTPRSSWAGGYCVDMLVVNNGAAAVSTWTVVLQTNGMTIGQQWNINIQAGTGTAALTPSGSYNAAIAAGGNANVQGFCVSGPAGAQAEIVSVTGS